MFNLSHVTISSIYDTPSRLLSSSMARLMNRTFEDPHGETITVLESFYRIVRSVKSRGGKVIVSDMFRTHEAQEVAHERKPKLVAPPGRSQHEAGLAFDIWIGGLALSYEVFAALVHAHGWETGAAWKKSEPWHIQLPYARLGFRSLAEAIEFVGNGG